MTVFTERLCLLQSQCGKARAAVSLYIRAVIAIKYKSIIKINRKSSMAKGTFKGIIILIAGVFLGGLAMLFWQARPSGGPGAALSPSQGFKSSRAFSEIVRAVSPSVVNISVTKAGGRGSSFSEDPFFDFFRDFFSPPESPGSQKKWKEQSFGSGVIVSPDGYIITNYHVVADADRLSVTLYDRRVFDGTVVGTDPKTDIAVVRISAEGIPGIAWGDSDKLQVGEFVLAIGDPFGLSHTVTMGIISAVGRANVGIADYEDFIQTDAAINPGNSGGPLVDSSGELIGINTAIFSRSGGYQGIGFAVPSNMARLIMEQLIKEGKVVRGWLGVTIQELTPELARKFGLGKPGGALVSESLRGGPAESSGIRGGDIVLEYGGREVGGSSEMKNMVSRSRPGTKVPVKLWRDGETLRLMVLVGEPPREEEKAAPGRPLNAGMDAFYGLSVIALTNDIARQLGLASDVRGVVVVGVKDGSPADDAGLKRGDVILEIDRRKILDLRDFREASSEARAEDAVLMYINRGGRKFFLTVLVS